MSNRNAVQATVTAAGQFTAALALQKGDRFTISLANVGAGSTYTVQRSTDGGVNWRTIKSYTADAEEDGIAGENLEIRLGCPTTFVAPGSGQTLCRLGT